MKSHASERTPKADLSALQPPVRSATSRHKKDSKKQILSDCSIGHGQNPVSSCPDWLEFMPDQESPPGCTLVTGILTQMKSYASERTPKADLSAIPI